MDADEIIVRYGLKPHPEGGHYRETFRAPAENNKRGEITAIYYLLKAGETSAWHRIDAVEIWHYYAGDSLQLDLSIDGIEIRNRILGLDTGRGAPDRCPCPYLAKRTYCRYLDISRMYRRTGFRICWFRAGATRLEASK